MKLLAAFPHPDDESWLLGGFLHRWSQIFSWELYTATTGEAGLPSTLHHTASRLRVDELAAAAALLGAKRVQVADFPDGALQADAPLRQAFEDELHRALPQLLMTFDARGGYGHRDHRALHEVVVASSFEGMRLFGTCPDPLAYRVWRRLRRFRGGRLALDEFPEMPAAERLAALSLSESEQLIKRRAIARHQSQLPRGGVEEFIDPDLMGELLQREWLAFEDEASREAFLRAFPSLGLTRAEEVSCCFI